MSLGLQEHPRMTTDTIVDLLHVWATCSIAGAVIGGFKGRVDTGALLGLLLGPLGIFLATRLATKTELDKRREESEAAFARATSPKPDEGPH
ncbi:MAG: hypothetical protein JNJ59_14995 [Deltaproteobacteria bacterium]|nr:hypothetical protein [Deltaproteobacteria bacterium]